MGKDGSNAKSNYVWFALSYRKREMTCLKLNKNLHPYESLNLLESVRT